MKVTPAKRMLKRAARAKLMVCSVTTSCRAAAWSAGGAVVHASAMPLGGQAAQHEDQAEDDGQVIGDPEPAVGDRAGDAFGVPDGSCRMEEIADQPQQGASDARVRPDAQDPPPPPRSGLPLPLAPGGLELVGAGFAGQQHQRRQHGQ